ncbi:hypothetical protein CORMATOL_02899 [Corynebacterium matruchotii ATCC 33806]|uniref:Uncharacterized protein n=1 Tax=Corynebacterium matruchotii ATCC 33806 TaxID=566549 RepID=C0E7A9_9CORY|nr:hypothetical protein CORMATOL_02899 [Corynebacterium matruchotii ATCC 33806]
MIQAIMRDLMDLSTLALGESREGSPVGSREDSTVVLGVERCRAMITPS